MLKTSDNQNELFDIVDENDQVVSQVKREEAHQNKNLIHRSIGVAVFNSKGELFLQQRSASKDTDPLKWTISCSGHVNIKIKNTNKKSKIYKETAHRELVEELGVDLEIEPICKYLCRAPNETEMQVLYKAIYDGPFRLNTKEIIQGKFFTKKELAYAVKRRKIELSFMGRKALEKLGWV